MDREQFVSLDESGPIQIRIRNCLSASFPQRLSKWLLELVPAMDFSSRYGYVLFRSRYPETRKIDLRLKSVSRVKFHSTDVLLEQIIAIILVTLCGINIDNSLDYCKSALFDIEFMLKSTPGQSDSTGGERSR